MLGVHASQEEILDYPRPSNDVPETPTDMSDGLEEYTPQFSKNSRMLAANTVESKFTKRTHIDEL